MTVLFGFSKVSDHRNLGARSLLPGHDLTDLIRSLEGSPTRECCRCGFDVALCKQRGPDQAELM